MCGVATSFAPFTVQLGAKNGAPAGNYTFQRATADYGTVSLWAATARGSVNVQPRKRNSKLNMFPV